MVYPANPQSPQPLNLLQPVYDHGPLPTSPWDSFTVIRDRVQSQWHQLPKKASVLSPELELKIKSVKSRIREKMSLS